MRPLDVINGMKHAGMWGGIHSFELGAFCPIHTAKRVKIPWEYNLEYNLVN